MPKILLTVDVEALPSRAHSDHVERLVYGRFDGRAPLGLRELMSEAEKLAMPLTCFFDYCEYDLYGDSFLDAAREIVSRGHDLQLHAHPEVMRAQTWEGLGLAKPKGPLNEFDDKEADRLFDWLLGLHAKVTSKAPVAFRGGGYRYSEAVLRAMRSHGLTLSSNHNPGRDNQLDARPSCELFRHANGILEAPISVLQRDGMRHELNFNQYGFERYRDWFLDAFPAQYGDRGVLNLVLHSRSLLAMDAQKKYYFPKNDELLASYRRLLASLHERRMEIVSAAGLLREKHLADIAAPPAPHAPAAPAAPAAPPPDAAVASRTDAPAAERAAARPACPVCADPKRQFLPFNGRELARCGTCGALERQRSLVAAWNTRLRHEVPASGRAALLVSPAKSERMIFSRLGFASTTTLDIRPEAGCDLVADLCAMPQVPDRSVDLVFASHVLPHVHDLEAALREIDRILTPEGAFLSFTPTRSGQPTTRPTDEAVAGWYGRDNLERHQVGTFRSFGDLGLLRDLQRHFVVKTFTSDDPVTGRASMWVCAWKLSAADGVRTLPKDAPRYR